MSNSEELLKLTGKSLKELKTELGNKNKEDKITYALSLVGRFNLAKFLVLMENAK